MSVLSTPSLHQVETTVLMPGTTGQSNIQERGWCLWNKDPSLTPDQRNLLKNMFITGALGVSLSAGAIIAACSLLDSTDYRFNAIASISVSTMLSFAAMACFTRPLQQVLHGLNHRPPEPSLP